MEQLYHPTLAHKPHVATPSAMFQAHLAADLSDEAAGAFAQFLFAGFMDSFQADTHYLTLAKAGARKLRLTKSAPKKLNEARAALAGGMADHSYLMAYGTAGAPDDLPTLPVLRISRAPLPMTSISVNCPIDHPASWPLLEAIDGQLTDMALISGLLGVGFALNPTSFQAADMPPAHLRYRCALMADDAPFSKLVRRDETWIKSRRLIQKRENGFEPIPEERLYDYTPGLPDIAWRTYVGTAFRDRLDPADGLAAKGVTVEHRPGHSVVTAGDTAIWGDVNAGETISAYQAAFAYLKPAMADRDLRIAAAPGFTSKDKERIREAEAYVDRFNE